jgi:hypothetical protein
VKREFWKTSGFNNFQVTGMESRRQSGLRVLPTPCNIHEYIDDVNHMAKDFDVIYLPRRGSSVKKRMTWTN